MSTTKGGFTLPGEAGYEKLTLEMAEKWGADVIRDSDGTVLSDEILDAGYGIYSTICIIRDHNDWAKKNMDKLQQTFLITQPVTAASDTLDIDLMKDFFEEQFAVNDTPDAFKYWQIYDRTTGQEVDKTHWDYSAGNRQVRLKGITPWHKYTVSFMAYRIWEEISMYNHTTNHWEKEHLMQIDPRYEEAQEYLLAWMKNWCETHQSTTVVRFTSMFYNFVWIWGSDVRNRNLFTDWASYDFTVSPRALDLFAETYGYSLTAEDFVNQGKYHVTHMPAGKTKRDWMDFINDFVIEFGKKLVSMVHDYGKKAYVFYDDSWVGIEPYNGRFEEFGFDGMIKCVFSGYEARLCSGVPVETHELRLHPYLFPTGINGSPTFLEGGNPKGEAQKYWQAVRRAVLRSPIERIGLGGYLHLVENSPEFVEYIADTADEFRMLKDLHSHGKPAVLKPRVAVLHYWGALRSWTLSGHFHETYMHDLIHINESLSGLPFDVSFISFEDVKNGALEEIDVVINAGYAGSAWSGGDCWKDEHTVSILTEWVYNGGTFIGVNEPSAADGYDTFFRMAHILGVDEDTGARVCHGKWSFTEEEPEGLFPDGSYIHARKGIYLTDGKASVLREEAGMPAVTSCGFGSGRGIYLASFEHCPENTRLLMNLILYGTGGQLMPELVTDNLHTECAYYPKSSMLVVINNSGQEQNAAVVVNGKKITCRMEGYGIYCERV